MKSVQEHWRDMVFGRTGQGALREFGRTARRLGAECCLALAEPFLRLATRLADVPRPDFQCVRCDGAIAGGPSLGDAPAWYGNLGPLCPECFIKVIKAGRAGEECGAGVTEPEPGVFEVKEGWFDLADCTPAVWPDSRNPRVYGGGGAGRFQRRHDRLLERRAGIVAEPEHENRWALLRGCAAAVPGRFS